MVWQVMVDQQQKMSHTTVYKDSAKPSSSYRECAHNPNFALLVVASQIYFAPVQQNI